MRLDRSVLHALLALVAALLVAGCGGSTPTAAPTQPQSQVATAGPVSGSPAAAPAGWRVVALGDSASISVPAEWEELPAGKKWLLNAIDRETGTTISVTTGGPYDANAAGAMRLAADQLKGSDMFTPPNQVDLPAGPSAVSLGMMKVGDTRVQGLKFFVPARFESYVVTFIGAPDASGELVQQIMNTLEIDPVSV